MTKRGLHVKLSGSPFKFEKKRRVGEIPPSSESPIKTFNVKPYNTPKGKGIVMPGSNVNYRLSKISGSPPKSGPRGSFGQRPPMSFAGRKLTWTQNQSPTSTLVANLNKLKIQSLKNGGTVRKTGLAYLHKGELVIPQNKVSMVKRAIAMYKRRTGLKK
tara:strand:+ start:50 stop:526 length:477 start_codon:yes stop_codon:yes gene_type:complete